MQWLPPNYRVIYSDEISYSQKNLEYIYLKLIEFLTQGALTVTLNGEHIAYVTNVELEGNRFCFWIAEKKHDFFLKNNVHLESFKVNLFIEGKMYGTELRIDNVLNILEMEKIDAVNSETQTETYYEV
jgi:hypothetical protein